MGVRAWMMGPVVGLWAVGTACPGEAPGGATTTAASSSDDDEGTHSSSAPAGDSTTDGGAATSTSTDPLDSSTGALDGTEESTGTPEVPGPDLREVGPHAVELVSDTVALDGCSMGYDLRVPAGTPDAPAVVLAHGFQGNRASMAGWAEHWASWGMRVVTPDLCHATIVDSDHAQNGQDLRALVAELGLPSVIYAGYSAGGLAAVLAAADDPLATALLGLDMVDSGGLGMAAAPGVGVPAFDVVGEPSQCNTTNNGLAVFASVAGSRGLRVTEADHCDFQSPADFLCGLTCTGTNARFDDETIQAAVRGLSTAAVLWRSELEPTGAQWWTPGAHYYDLLTGVGIVQEP